MAIGPLVELRQPAQRSLTGVWTDLKVTDYATSGVPLIRIQRREAQSIVVKGTRYVSSTKAAGLSRHDYRPAIW